jgi:signal transduction histidine kinase
VVSPGCDPLRLTAAATARIDAWTSPDSGDPAKDAIDAPPSDAASRPPEPGDAAAPPRSAAWLPVRLEERTLGCVYLADEQTGMLRPETREMAATAAMKLAAAVERILYKERLKKSEQTLRLLSERLMTAQEEERARISRELHDSIGSSLCAIRLSLAGALKGKQDSKAIERILTMTQVTIDEVRRIMTDLRPSILDQLGIVAALRWACRQFNELYPAIIVNQDVDIGEHDIPEPLKIVVFRIVQESFTNIGKYSQAGAVTLSLCKRDGSMRLSIQDDGIGFDPGSVVLAKDPRTGLGLASMKERAKLSGGVFALKSCPGGGTRVLASWPLSPAGRRR